MARFAGLPDSVPAFVDSVRRRLPHQEAIRERGTGSAGLTYQQLWDRAARVAGGLRDAGIVPGDRVALTLGNGIDWCLGLLGTLMAGAVAVPVNSRLAPVERTFVLRDSGATLALRPGQSLPEGRPYVEESLSSSDLACIVYTSGTTGVPKGAMLTSENLCVAAEVVIARAGAAVRRAAKPGGSAAVSRHGAGQPAASDAVDRRHRRHHAGVRGQRLARGHYRRTASTNWWPFRPSTGRLSDTLRFAPKTDVRWVGYGAAPTPPHEVARIAEAFPQARLGPGYGLTESGGSVCSLPHEYAIEHSDSVGLAAPGRRSQTARPGLGRSGANCSCAAPAWRQGTGATKRRRLRSFATDGCTPAISPASTREGFVVIVDRLKDTVNRGGENVYCVEVEKCARGTSSHR